MMRNWFAISVVLMLGGCINTPNTKALVTPFGGIGIHSFAPRDSQHVREVNPDRMARLETNDTSSTGTDEKHEKSN